MANFNTVFCSNSLCEWEATNYFREENEVYGLCAMCHEAFMWGQAFLGQGEVWPDSIDDMEEQDIRDHYTTHGWTYIEEEDG